MHPHRLSMRLAIFSVIALLLVACSGGSSRSSQAVNQSPAQQSNSASATSKTITVLISQFKYKPDPITVNVGDTIEWKNADIVPHTVTSEDKQSFDSGSIAKGASWRFTAAKRGTFNYFCTLHPNMKAKLIVQ